MKNIANSIVFDTDEIRDQLIAAMKDNNCEPHDPNEINQFDGNIHRYTIEGHKTASNNGAYKVYSEGWPNGWFQDWKTGNKDDIIKWKFDIENSKHRNEYQSWTDEQRAQFKEENERKMQARKAEAEKKRIEALNKAKAEYNRALPYYELTKREYNQADEHAYFFNKGIIPQQFQYSNIRLLDNKLIIPLVNARTNQLQTYQYIIETGVKDKEKLMSVNFEERTKLFAEIKSEKRFLKDVPTSEACYIFWSSGYFEGSPKIALVAEGYTTALQCRVFTGTTELDKGTAITKYPYPVIASMNCGNMGKVISGLKHNPQFIGYRFIVCADNDHKTKEKTGKNTGIDEAEKLLKEGLIMGYITPVFEPDEEGTDWEDFENLHINKGKDIFNEQLTQVLNGNPRPNNPENYSDTEPDEPIMLDYEADMQEYQNGKDIEYFEDLMTTDNGQMDKDNMSEMSVPNTASNGRKIYSGFSVAECCANPKPTEWLIEDILPEQNLAMMFAPPESAKSFVSTDMALSIASPEIETWHGKKLKHGHVVYLAGEGSNGVRKRIAGWVSKRGVNPELVKLRVIDEPFHLNQKGDKEHSFEATIENIKMCCGGEDPVLIIFDTLNTFLEGDENQSQYAGEFTMLCKKLMLEMRTAVEIVHHTGKDPLKNREARGSSALKANVDIELIVSKNGNEVKLEHGKAKDIEKMKPMVFNLEQMAIPDWFDNNGKPVTTCTIELDERKTQLEEQYSPDYRDKKTKTPINEKRGKDTFTEAVRRYGTEIKAPDGEKAIAIARNDWKKVFFDMTPKDNLNDRKEVERLRKQFERVISYMTEETRILKIENINKEDFYYIETNGETHQEFREHCQLALIAHQNSERVDETGDLF